MDWLNELLKQPIIKWTIFVILVIFAGFIIIFFIQYNIDRTKGKHAKFLWFESNIPTTENYTLTDTKGRNNELQNHKKAKVENVNPPPDNTAEKNVNLKPKEENVTITNSKNVNTGKNYGNIGDTYTGIEQRHFTNQDAKELIVDIEQFKIKYKDKIDSSHITIGYPGDKESKIVAAEAEQILKKNGFPNIQISILKTYGVTGKLFGISNAPDNSILVEIFPADNEK